MNSFREIIKEKEKIQPKVEVLSKKITISPPKYIRELGYKIKEENSIMGGINMMFYDEIYAEEVFNELNKTNFKLNYLFKLNKNIITFGLQK